MICKACGYSFPDGPVCLRCGAIQEKLTGKSRRVAGMLGIFLGVFGIHNFYLGYTGKAMAQLLITVFSVFTLGIISWSWGLVEGIRCLQGVPATDAWGRPLRA